MIPLLVALIELTRDLVQGTRSEEDAAKALIDAAFATGVPASLLASYLTAKAAEDAERAADLAQWIKRQ